jgi:hypothetical protein
VQRVLSCRAAEILCPVFAITCRATTVREWCQPAFFRILVSCAVCRYGPSDPRRGARGRSSCGRRRVDQPTERCQVSPLSFEMSDPLGPTAIKVLVEAGDSRGAASRRAGEAYWRSSTLPFPRCDPAACSRPQPPRNPRGEDGRPPAAGNTGRSSFCQVSRHRGCETPESARPPESILRDPDLKNEVSQPSRRGSRRTGPPVPLAHATPPPAL